MDPFPPDDYPPGSPDPLALSDFFTFDGYSDLPPSPFFPAARWPEFTSLSPDTTEDGSCSGSGSSSSGGRVVPRSLHIDSLSDRMLKALSLVKVAPDGGFLAQVWMPVRHGNDYVLSTSDQPYLLDHMLAGYREISRAFTFSPKESPGAFPGLPGRVFMSGMPEWTSNVAYYNPWEYLRAEHALSHEVRGSLAVPVFDLQGRRKCAVLELVTTREKPNFDSEMENVCNALQAVGLQTSDIRTHQQVLIENLNTDQKSALSEILDVLRAVCHAHMLPLALTWIPVCYDGERMEEILDGSSSVKKKSMLCVQKSASYVNDIRMQGFLHACAEHNLEKGQGPAGKALESNQAFFSADVKGYDIREYPLAHHARKYGLRAAVAIRLRSTYTGGDDYVLELFLPVICTGGTEQQLLLDSLSNTMQRICRSLRRVLDDGGVDAAMTKVEIHREERTDSPSSTNISFNQSQGIDHGQHSLGADQDNELVDKVPFQNKKRSNNKRSEGPQHAQLHSRLPKYMEKKRTLEKNVSLNVLQQHFSGSLKDAAKSIGVCPTTLKRICRQHGVSRWPSRKIKKVNRSLEKIQTVINSVEGVEGSLKYDPATGCLVAAVSSSEKPATTNSDGVGLDVMPATSSHYPEIKKLVGKLNRDDCSVDRKQIDTSGHLNFPPTNKFETDKTLPHDLYVEGFECQLMSTSSITTAAVDEINARIDGLAEHSNPSSSSSMTDSSSSSALSCPSFHKISNNKACAAEGGSTITVKATYKEDTVRFKLLPSLGCNQLFEEIGKRFKLRIGTFQLKYMDDEEEWVMLASDLDLQECIDVLGSMGSRTMKLLVRDDLCAIGSSASSNWLLVNHTSPVAMRGHLLSNFE